MPLAETHMVNIKPTFHLQMLLYPSTCRESTGHFFRKLGCSGNDKVCWLWISFYVGALWPNVYFYCLCLTLITSWNFGFGKVLIVWDNLEEKGRKLCDRTLHTFFSVTQLKDGQLWYVDDLSSLCPPAHTFQGAPGTPDPLKRYTNIQQFFCFQRD